MASTYSQYKIELVGTGEQAGTWGTTTNNNFGSATPGTYQGFEQAIGGRADVTMSGTTTLSLTNSNAAQDARALYLNLSGTLSGAADLVVPALQKSYLVKNGTTGGFAVTIKVTGQTGVSIPNGKTVWVYNNGTDVVTAVDFIPEIATTTVDATNIEVTNIKAKDGTSAGSIADSTGVVTLASSVLTTTDINGGTIDGAVIGGASAAAGSFTSLSTSGAVVFNDAGADVDFRVEGDTEANLLFVDASTDRVGIGTSTPASKLHIQANANAISVDDGLSVRNSNSGSSAGARIALGNDVGTAPGLQLASSTNTTFGANALTVYQNLSAPVTFWTNNTERMRIDSDGRALVGLTSWSAAAKLVVGPDTNGNTARLAIASSGTDENPLLELFEGTTRRVFLNYAASGNICNLAAEESNSALAFQTAATERMRIDSSGNVGIGTSSPSSRFTVRAAAGGTDIADCIFQVLLGDDGTFGGGILAVKNAGNRGDIGNAAGSTLFNFEFNNAPGMSMDKSGNLLVGTTSANPAVSDVIGAHISNNRNEFSVDSSVVGIFNRKTNDGEIIQFRQQGTQEGDISVSGTTVSYNGGHLSRWAQMLTKPDLLKGTVMSNLDEMNVYVKPTLYWTEEDELPVDEEGNPTVVVGDLKQETSVSDNEQLNKVKVSDVEGDPNVAGVFVNWTYDEAHQVDEINMAMTGDMIIRIAEGVTVARGDLLMSAGDGTAKPQGDDIVRSKTIAKVTSTHVTCTYEDGSYCVPCVLMAC
jgi:hypothetical protein